jgi:hypothetical protein
MFGLGRDQGLRHSSPQVQKMMGLRVWSAKECFWPFENHGRDIAVASKALQLSAVSFTVIVGHLGRKNVAPRGFTVSVPMARC